MQTRLRPSHGLNTYRLVLYPTCVHCFCLNLPVLPGTTSSSSLPAGRPFRWINSAAEHQKIRSEQQAAAQSSGKRTQIDFTSSKGSSSFASRALISQPNRPSKEHDLGQKSRFNPYLRAYDGARGNGYKKERERSKWV
jgi:hypothetical protein